MLLSSCRPISIIATTCKYSGCLPVNPRRDLSIQLLILLRLRQTGYRGGVQLLDLLWRIICRRFWMLTILILSSHFLVRTRRLLMERCLGIIYHLALAPLQIICAYLRLIKMNLSFRRSCQCLLSSSLIQLSLLLQLYQALFLVFLLEKVLVCVQKVGDRDATPLVCFHGLQFLGISICRLYH